MKHSTARLRGPLGPEISNWYLFVLKALFSVLTASLTSTLAVSLHGRPKPKVFIVLRVETPNVSFPAGKALTACSDWVDDVSNVKTE